MTWTPEQREKLKTQLQTVKEDIAVIRPDYPDWDTTDHKKHLIGTRLDTIDVLLNKMIKGCDDPELIMTEKL